MSDATIDGLSPGELATVVELQQIELKRLLGEQKRLNDRIDQLLRLQEREQVLRQQMQAALDRLAEQRAAAGADRPSALPSPQLERRLHRTEARFKALQSAVGLLVDLIERTSDDDPPHGPPESGGGHVRVFAPGAPETQI
ncbi:MAG: hypothetical protein JJ899_00855 [Alphaproteobacteria bacterium]|nr:hypothetical protein [Alphaproteobacteria bacterium]